MAYTPEQKLRPSTIKKYEEGKKLYLSGMSIEQVAKTLRLERRKFSYYLKDAGIEVCNPTVKRSLNENYFSVIDTEDKAYWLGFLYADGCINVRKKDGKVKSMNIEVGLQYSDRSHLIKFAESLEYVNYKLEDRVVDGSQTTRIVIHCTKMARDLINKGCTPKKSLTLNFPRLPKHLIDDFIRGYIDGDGYIGVRLNTNNQVLRMSVLGTMDVLNGIIEHFDLTSTEYRLRHDKRHSVEIHSLELNQGGVSKIIKIYKNAKISLARKYDLVLPFIENVD